MCMLICLYVSSSLKESFSVLSSVYLFVCLSIFFTSIFFLYKLYLCVCLLVQLSVSVIILPSVCLILCLLSCVHMNPHISPSSYLAICLSVCLSVRQGFPFTPFRQLILLSVSASESCICPAGFLLHKTFISDSNPNSSTIRAVQVIPERKMVTPLIITSLRTLASPHMSL